LAIKKPPSRAVDLDSVAVNAVFVNVMHASAVLDGKFSRFLGMAFWVSSQIIPGIQLFQRLPVLLEPFLRGRTVDAELHQSLTVARDFEVIARIRLFGQPDERHVDGATIGQGAAGEVMFDGIHNQKHAVRLCLGSSHNTWGCDSSRQIL
jgi:hypothetical protein